MIHKIQEPNHATVVETVCGYHKEHKGSEYRNYAGCTCGAKYSLHSGKAEDCKLCLEEANDR